METNRIALISYDADGARCVGSGLLVNEQIVLTADHVADGSGYEVEVHDQVLGVSRVIRSGTSEVDIAVLVLATPIAGVTAMEYARVDKQNVGSVEKCTAVGYPRWKRKRQRRSAQVDGIVPTGEDLNSGYLTLIGNRRPEKLITKGSVAEKGTVSPWGGMSGAVVVAGGRWIIGVVRSDNLAGDGQSLTITPLTAIGDTPAPQRAQLWAALSIHDPTDLSSLPKSSGVASAPAGYHYDLYVSYWPDSCIAPWVRNRFMDPFRYVLREELGREPRIAMQPASDDDIGLIANSRILLAILSKQYFDDKYCRAVFDSMCRRQCQEGLGTTDNPTFLVHAVVADDFQSDESIPDEYYGAFKRENFNDWAYDFPMDGWAIYTAYQKAIRQLGSSIGEAMRKAPAWKAWAPPEVPAQVSQSAARKPTF